MTASAIILMLLLAGPPQGDLTDIPCSQCHTPDAWKPLDPDRSFKHARDTLFPLTGRHQDADCIQCHPGETAEETHAFAKARPECSACHMDIHMNQMGSECDRCHNSNDWDMSRWTNNHSRTVMPIDGMHASLECRDCHGINFDRLVGQMSTDCVLCHKQQFDEAQVTVVDGHPDNEDCRLCHNSRAWVPIDMSLHDSEFFPIYTGSHRGTWSTCTAECHIDPTDYQIFSCGLNNVCHEHDKSKMDRKHRGEVSGYSYNSQKCYDCHSHGGGGD